MTAGDKTYRQHTKALLQRRNGPQEIQASTFKCDTRQYARTSKAWHTAASSRKPPHISAIKSAGVLSVAEVITRFYLPQVYSLRDNQKWQVITTRWMNGNKIIYPFSPQKILINVFSSGSLTYFWQISSAKSALVRETITEMNKRYVTQLVRPDQPPQKKSKLVSKQMKESKKQKNKYMKCIGHGT